MRWSPALAAATARGRPPARRAGRLVSPPGAAAGGGNGGRVRSSPLARRMASERGLDLGQVQGSGPGGRIIKRDIEEAVAQAPAAAAAAPAAPRVARDGDFRDVPLTQ